MTWRWGANRTLLPGQSEIITAPGGFRMDIGRDLLVKS
eukprot:CAMPEP_0183313072 /NCGR_PEP_ID=MMETSP0160_2-20130417/43996_1 /TAXON_ID=2839 ORGANISM="Odontella Sinensis, Strain Grunow 1884" /NCGR_SAMPLE_ID=MMETSP0160_2 /ASSEMBLY_ACC=CAM_ASM_000250 /LENGTH=37 /DNA_ID= /DNA_START= /DNA_END= /DNA_ORIENTATION=